MGQTNCLYLFHTTKLGELSCMVNSGSMKTRMKYTQRVGRDWLNDLKFHPKNKFLKANECHKKQFW